MTIVSDGFVLAFLQSFLINIWVAAASLLLGLAIGSPLAWLRNRAGWMGLSSATFTAILRAAPTFVVMFFLLNVIPDNIDILGFSLPIPNVLTLVLALSIYAAAYVSDNLLDALRHMQRGSQSAALLFVPNMLRAFIVLVMASSTGAAIGVQEAVTTTLRETDRLSTIGSRIGLVIAVILFFASLMQVARFGARWLTAFLSAPAIGPAAVAMATTEQTEAAELVVRDA